MNGIINLYGEIEERVDGILVNKQRNSIVADFRRNLRDYVYNSGGSGLVIANTLITSGDSRNTSGSSQIGRNGIAICDGNYGGYGGIDAWFSLETTASTGGGYYIEFVGRSVVSEAREVVWANLGVSYRSSSANEDPFLYPVASARKSDNPVNLSTGQLYELTWRITF